MKFPCLPGRPSLAMRGAPLWVLCYHLTGGLQQLAVQPLVSRHAQQRKVLQLFRMQGLMLYHMQGHPMLDTKGRAQTSCLGALKTGKTFCQAHTLPPVVMLLYRHRCSPFDSSDKPFWLPQGMLHALHQAFQTKGA